MKRCGLERQSCTQGEHMTELAQPLDVAHWGVFDIGSHPNTIDAGSEVNIYPTHILDTPMAVCFATQIQPWNHSPIGIESAMYALAIKQR